MDSSTRLYARLAEIPQDSSDLDSLDDLLVCAFGAFERYYLCWKTKGGEFRHGKYTCSSADVPAANTEQMVMICHLPCKTGSTRPMAQHETLQPSRSSSVVVRSTSPRTRTGSWNSRSLQSRSLPTKKQRRPRTQRLKGRL
jgi:hypothetical protein